METEDPDYYETSASNIVIDAYTEALLEEFC